MYYVISRFAYVLIAPENWMIALFIAMLLVRSQKAKKVLAISLLLFVLFFGNEYIFTSLVNRWQPQPVEFKQGESFEAGIVLGGSSSFDKYGRGYLNASADRFIETCILYKTGKIKKILISGGSNAAGQPTDAEFQFKKMTELGIIANDIIIENASLNTFENATFSKIIIDSLKLKPPFVLITSAMHIPRSKLVFAKAGLPVVPYPCNYAVVESNPSLTDYLIPKISTVLSWSPFLKELVGIAGYKLFNKA